MDPINLTPYNSAQVDDPKTLAKPFDTPIRPKKRTRKLVIESKLKLIKKLKKEYSYI